MQEDYTIFNIPRAEKEDSAEVFVEKNDPEPRDIFEGVYGSVSVEVSDIYDELNQIAEELEICRLRNC